MINRDYCVTMARYNSWQNKQLTGFLEALDPADRLLDRGRKLVGADIPARLAGQLLGRHRPENHDDFELGPALPQPPAELAGSVVGLAAEIAQADQRHPVEIEPPDRVHRDMGDPARLRGDAFEVERMGQHLRRDRIDLPFAADADHLRSGAGCGRRRMLLPQFLQQRLHALGDAQPVRRGRLAAVIVAGEAQHRDADCIIEGHHREPLDLAFGDLDGFVGGGQIGYNYQLGQVVLGVEADFQGADLKAGPSFAGLGIVSEGKTEWFGTVRGRVGFAFDRFLPYVTGGLAYGSVKTTLAPGVTINGLNSDDNTHTGWTVGGGVEYAITNNLVAGVEYLYVDLGDKKVFNGADKVSTDFSLVRARLSYKF